MGEVVVLVAVAVLGMVIGATITGPSTRRGGGYQPTDKVLEGGPPPGVGGVARPRRKLPPPNLNLIDTNTPGGREVKRRIEKRLEKEGRTPPPPRGGSGQDLGR